MRRTRFLNGLALTFLLLGIACGSSAVRDPETITVEEATTILNQAHEASIQHDLDSLCGLGGSVLSCETAWQNSGEWDAVSDEQPAVVGSSVLPERDLGNGNRDRGGRLIIVEGTDGFGRPYTTDFLVFDAGEGRLVALNPVYWTGVKVDPLPSNDSGVAEPVVTPGR